MVLQKISCVIINQDYPRTKDKATSDLGSLCFRDVLPVPVLAQNKAHSWVTADRLGSALVNPMSLFFDAIIDKYVVLWSHEDERLTKATKAPHKACYRSPVRVPMDSQMIECLPLQITGYSD